VMQWMPPCLAPPSKLERVGGNAADLNWRLKLGGPVVSWHELPVTLSRNG
jgi:hypothetical protein